MSFNGAAATHSVARPGARYGQTNMRMKLKLAAERTARLVPRSLDVRSGSLDVRRVALTSLNADCIDRERPASKRSRVLADYECTVNDVIFSAAANSFRARLLRKYCERVTTAARARCECPH